MYLKKLTMQAFGPFKDKVIIDFEKQKIDRGLVLITGDTGAGKTTIFDAICYALYGQTSGSSRNNNSLRSDWASDDIDTFVDLEFYYKNKLYNIRRSPEYIRKKKNGIGETKQLPLAEANINGKIITKLNDVNKEVENLIGLDYNQFRQVAMLSQGEFTKFLLATSEEKTTIFRKIFDTEFYDNLQNRLKSNMLIQKDEIEKVKAKIETEQKNLEPIINIYGLNSNETIKLLEDKIIEETSKVNEAKKSRDNISEEKTKLTTEISNIDKMNKNILTYQTTTKKLEELISNNPNISLDKEKYNYNISCATSISLILDKLKTLQDSLNTKKEKYDLNLKKLKLKQKEQIEKENIFKQIDTYSKDVNNLTNYINKLENLNKTYNDYLNRINDLKILENDYKILTDKYLTKEQLYESMRTNYYLNISVEIAENLVEGKECPVCGSKTHPNIAKPTKCNYTKADLEVLEKELKEIDNNRKLKEVNIEQTNKLIKELSIPSDLNVYEELEKNSKLLENSKKEKQELESKFEIITNEKQILSSEIKSLESNNNIYKEDIASLEKDITKYNQKLNEIYIENNTNYDEYLKNKLEKYELLTLKDKIDNYESSKKEQESTIKLLEQEVKGKSIVDISEKEKQLRILFNKYQEYDNKYTSLNANLEKLKSSTNNIKNYINDNSYLQEKYNIVKILSDTASGNLIGKQRITFENYVQSYYMQSVLIEANKRLIKMTDGRYELKKKETETKMNTKTGLDFSIFDSYTGKERDVASLSGGEKFKASLALALGLSDTISNNRGGIKIDSLFIDEGFGSLDTESLNQALNILSELSGNDKLIGVISHVTELIGRIDNKIIVNKTNTGSNLTIQSY